MRRALVFGVASFLLAGGVDAQPPREQSLRTFLQNAFAEARENYSDTSYVNAFADLNGDGRDEALVYLSSGYFCGSGGCDLYIYTPVGRSWREVTSVSVGRPPIRLLNTRRHGWRDLGIFVAGGGARPHEARLSFNGRTYSTNASTAPVLRRGIAGRVLIAADAEGRPLF